MRKCNNCGKEIQLGTNHIRVRADGYKDCDADFCKPECFEEYYSKRRYILKSEGEAVVSHKK